MAPLASVTLVASLIQKQVWPPRELSNLMTPRPFMVERGHDDGVGEDEWGVWEYAKVRRHDNKLGLGDKPEIEFFNGPTSTAKPPTSSCSGTSLAKTVSGCQCVPKRGTSLESLDAVIPLTLLSVQTDRPHQDLSMVNPVN